MKNITEIIYKRDEKGNEIKFPITPNKGFIPSKHQATKRDWLHFLKPKKKKVAVAKYLSNHERIIAKRAKKQKMTVEKYKELYCSKAD